MAAADYQLCRRCVRKIIYDAYGDDLGLFCNSCVKKMLIIAYSSGYEHGHHDTVEGVFSGCGRSEHHDTDASLWLEEAMTGGTFEREIEI